MPALENGSSRGTALCLSNEAYGTARLPELLHQWARDDIHDVHETARQGIVVRRVCIPMSDSVDSLNVATAGAILMHQLGGARLTWDAAQLNAI